MGGRLERPKKGDRITHEWACALVDAILELQHHPKVSAPLVVRDGHIGFGDNYEILMVQTTSTITAKSGTTMGSGTVKLLQSPGGVVADNGGSNISRDVRSALNVTVPSGKDGYIAWVNGEWHLISVVGC